MNLDDIADQIIGDLDLREQVNMANMAYSDLDGIETVLAHYIAIKLKEDKCYGDANEVASHEAQETMEIVKRGWERLKEKHRLRVVI
jgi:predicted P-loop ATPase